MLCIIKLGSQKWNRVLERWKDYYDLAYILGLEDYNSYEMKETKIYLIDTWLMRKILIQIYELWRNK